MDRRVLDRRAFLKAAGVAGAALALPLGLERILSRALAAPLPLDLMIYQPPAVVPQVIHIFLYGGPSELAGNLTNIGEINANSQNPYPTQLDPNNANTVVTPNGFWSTAGGGAMETMLAAGDLSVYRSMNRIKDDSKAHGPSVFQNLVGNLDTTRPGIATTLAAILAATNRLPKDVNALVLPCVSFEGDAVVFNTGDASIPVGLKAIALDSNFRNPYERANNFYLSGKGGSDPHLMDGANNDAIEALAQAVSAGRGAKLAKINEAFAKRGELAAFIGSLFNSATVDANLPVDPADPNGGRIQYPNTNFGSRLKAAVSLAIVNPDTLFISLGSSGLGGWDDHSDAFGEYPARMQGLMDALSVAVKHMKLAGRDNIMINVFGDFGRNVNLNDAMGWDHGNNQNLYTLGGSGLPGRALGKIVGRTERVGTPFENRQFTAPAAGSYQFEPFAVASTIYRYFGVQNPEIFTGEPPIDEVGAPNEKLP